MHGAASGRGGEGGTEDLRPVHQEIQASGRRESRLAWESRHHRKHGLKKTKQSPNAIGIEKNKHLSKFSKLFFFFNFFGRGGVSCSPGLPVWLSYHVSHHIPVLCCAGDGTRSSHMIGKTFTAEIHSELLRVNCRMHTGKRKSWVWHH